MSDVLEKVEKFYDDLAPQRDFWKKKNSYYHEQITRLYKYLIPKGQNLAEIGCGTGDLLAALKPAKGVGLDISDNTLKIARKKFPNFRFVQSSAENISLNQQFDYVVLSDAIGSFVDIQKVFEELHKITTENTRIIINYYNFLWEPILLLGEKFGLKTPSLIQNWLSRKDIVNLLELSHFEIIKESSYLLLPIYIPFLSDFINKYLARLPILNYFCLVNYFVVRQTPNLSSDKDYSVSLIIPARNESGNIEKAVQTIPQLGNNTQLVFVEGHSRDDTKEKIKEIIKKYKNKKDILFVDQGNGVGKADAVRKGIEKSNGDIIIIFDADLTVDPEDLPKFYQAIRTKTAEFVQGSRLVYPMENEAMRVLNIFGNKFFSAAFSFLLDQRIKDTLCGTKALFRKDYARLAINRSYFGDFDPFGDFDLIFGTSKLHLKIREIPIRYKARTYGSTNISRFRHGWLLLKMTVFAARKIKFF